MELRVFIELSIFKDKVDALDDVELLRSIQAEILKNPEKGDIVRGQAALEKFE